MKLYTEEQVMDIILDSFISEYPTNANDILSNYTAIEIPNDNDIEKEIKGFMFEKNKEIFYNGAKWMRDKIINK